MNSKLIIKWKPILKVVNIDEEYYDIISKYCEYHYSYENAISRNETTSLPSSLQILSKIDLSKVEFVFEDYIKEPKIFSISLTSEEYLDYTYHLGLDVIKLIESKMIEEIYHYINEIIKEEGNIAINKVCYKSIIEDIDFKHCVKYYSKIIYGLDLRRIKLEKLLNNIKN